MNWGLVGYGNIAKRFLAAIEILDTEEVVAIASLSKYDTIKHDFPNKVKAYSSYDQLFDDPEVEIVYICTTHNFHKANVIQALNAGKHVLCEKPLGINESEVKSMVEVAKEKKRFLMEAMWTRFLPAYRKMRDIIDQGILGEVVLLQANFGYRTENPDPQSRLFNKKLAGGSVLDVGVYPIALMLDLFGSTPLSATTSGIIHETGVDTSCSMFFQFSDNRSAHLFSSILIDTKHDALITGDKGWIQFLDFWQGTKIILNTNRDKSSIELPLDLNGFEYQIRACREAVSNGLTEHPWMSHADSQRIAAIMDTVMETVGYGRV